MCTLQACSKSSQSTLVTLGLLNTAGNVAPACTPESRQVVEKNTNVSFRPYAPVIWEREPKHVGVMEFMDMLPPANVANIHSSIRFCRFNVNIYQLFVKTWKKQSLMKFKKNANPYITYIVIAATTPSYNIGKCLCWFKTLLVCQSKERISRSDFT